ncbi:hypothetical protein ACFWNC_26755 [Streptomyces sp. NPDC058369]|uniref:hypothetical protein n=1 Tax=Streptomyces sp. NPDC058369 TaxID=3346462 RepID=UPI00364BAC42
MRYSVKRTARFARHSGLVAAVASGVVLSGVPSFAYTQDEPGPGASGRGAGSYAKPSDIPADGLKYAVALPFYQKNGAYVATAATPQDIAMGATNTISLTQSVSTSQTLPQGVSTSSESTVSSVLGAVLKTTVAKIAARYGIDEGAAEQAVNSLFGLNSSTAKNPEIKEKVTFATSNKMTIKAVTRSITARPVFYRVKTVSDEWVKDDGSGALRLTDQNVVSDVVVKMGWQLECGEKLCRPGVDYTQPGMDPKPADEWPADGLDIPPSGVPDVFEPGKEHAENGVRWTGSGPAPCDVKSTGPREEAGGVVKWMPLAVKCPRPKWGDPRAFESYRFAYHVEGMVGPGPNDWDSDYANGTISDSPGYQRHLVRSVTDTESMREQKGIPADGEWHHFALNDNLTVGGFYADPKWRVDIIPVESYMEPGAVIGPVINRGYIRFSYEFTRPGDRNYIRVYRSGADIKKDDYLAMRIPSPEAGQHTVVMTEPRSWPRGEYTVHAMTEKDGRLVSLASRDFRA